MGYNDFLISSPKQFENLAREYSQMLKSKNSLLETGKELINLFQFLSFVYETILKNSNGQRLTTLMDNLIHGLSLDISDVCLMFSIDPKTIKLKTPKNLNTLRDCLKLSISTESVVVLKLIEILKATNSAVVNEISLKHLETIKQLTKYI